MSRERSKEQEEFLREINSGLPDGINWKQGAIDYLTQLIESQGPHAERYHLIKPFVGGPDFAPFIDDMRQFLNLIEKLDLPMRSSIVDVACGPGWMSYYLGKLGHKVLGIDISAEMVEIAARRLSSDPYPPYPDSPFQVEFAVHDIESSPIGAAGPFDVAILASCLHHFHDPVAALENLTIDLNPEGLIAVVEGSKPEEDTVYHRENLEIMEGFHTLERPYSRGQIARLLRLTGFDHFEFYYPINGLFPQSRQAANDIRDRIVNGMEWNIVFASRSKEGMKRISETFDRGSPEKPSMEFLSGFYDIETDPGGEFRWSSPKSTISINRVEQLELILGSHLPRETGRQQNIYVFIDGKTRERVALTASQPRKSIRLPDIFAASRIDLYSDCAFSPKCSGGEDERILSFMVRVGALGNS
ncbi:MAG: class I SAM-dependent methyltransferase [Candidatus Coatesbacteria bacterium]|nr:class I SAM-dependent methyltransferase [Candidatus Coatesbacteria bacterium]